MRTIYDRLRKAGAEDGGAPAQWRQANGISRAGMWTIYGLCAVIFILGVALSKSEYVAAWTNGRCFAKPAPAICYRVGRGGR